MPQDVVTYGRLAALFNDLELKALGLGTGSRYRKRAVDLLGIGSSSRVIDFACGTGLNFKVLEQYVGDGGRIVGVDISPQMLRAAENRVIRQGWENIDLVNMPISDFEPDTPFDAALCTLALEAIPEYEEVLDGIFRVLKPGGKLAVIGMKPSSHPLFKLMNPIVIAMGRLGGIDYRAEVINHVRSAHSLISLEEFMGGFFYILTARS